MDSQDYETNRNLTLMFFLEKLLVEKGSTTDNTNQPHTRSLHDLSCQFGTRGFSKEMRQIAGGDLSQKNLWLADTLMDLYIEHRNKFIH